MFRIEFDLYLRYGTYIKLRVHVINLLRIKVSVLGGTLTDTSFSVLCFSVHKNYNSWHVAMQTICSNLFTMNRLNSEQRLEIIEIYFEYFRAEN